MEERKRPNSYDQAESGPPLKKQATSNGTGKTHDTDMPWKDDLEKFQKDAIFRQMQEYKREKNTLESQLKEMRKKARYHDEHLQIIDAWFKQLIDEVKLVVSAQSEDVDMLPTPSALLFSEQEKFQEHLQSRTNDIRHVMSAIYQKVNPTPPEVSEMQSRLAQLLAAEKDHILQLERAQADKEELESRLEAASLRYMLAEKKIDRAKSVTVAKLEKQTLLGGVRQSSEDGGPVKREDTQVNGVIDHGEELAELEAQLNKTVAASDKQKEQLSKLEEENSKLTAELTSFSTKSATPSDDEYAKTELFKQLKAQHDDVIKRINDLEATNAQLKEEAQKLQSERAAYQSQLESESRVTLTEKDAQLAAAEANLARIRSNRDEILADQTIKKAALDQEREALRKVQELASAQEERIKALESESERLTMQSGDLMQTSDLDGVSLEELRSQHTELRRKYNLLDGELASMSTAFQKTSKLASQKVAEYSALEEKVLRLTAEKAKADQKFFAAMKSKETRDGELRTLRLQNTKSAEIMSQLKDAEASSRSLLANLEKQIVEANDALAKKTTEHRALQQQKTVRELDVSRLNGQVSELKQLLVAKDSTAAQTANLCRAAEVEVEELKASLTDTRRNLESWKSKSGQSEQYELLRTIAYCNICKKELKNTVIKTCGHTFCSSCVEERLTSRSRKCPNCGKAFGNNDYQRIVL